MKIIKWILCILAVIAVLVIGFFAYCYFIVGASFKGNPDVKLTAVKQTNEVKNILFRQRGVKESAISSIKTEYSWELNQYITYVIYKDEPKASYGYYYMENGDVVLGPDRPIHDIKKAILVQNCKAFDNNHKYIVDENPERKHKEKTCQFF